MIYTTQKQIRAAFWELFPECSKKRGRDGDYLTDTRVSFCDFVEMLSRNGDISEALAQRVTL